MASPAEQFLQYGQLRAQLSQDLGNNIGGTIDLAMQLKQKREAELAALRQKEMERQIKAQESALEPQAILTKANQLGVEALTPQERAAFQASQQIEGAKIVYDQFGQPRSGYSPIQLGVASTPLMPQPTMQAEPLPAQPQMQPRGVADLLMPPVMQGENKSRAEFDAFMGGGDIPSPIGRKEEKIMPAPNEMSVPDMAVQRLRDMGVEKPQRPAVLDYASSKQYEADLAAYNDALKQQREAVFAEKKTFDVEKKAAPSLVKDLETSISMVDKAIQQSNALNTGFGRDLSVFGKSVNPFAGDLKATLGTIQAKTALDSLIKAKEQGATFGALSDAELQLLKDRTASLDRAQSQAQLDENLNLIRTQYDDILQKVKARSGMGASNDIVSKLKAAGYTDAQIQAYMNAKGIK